MLRCLLINLNSKELSVFVIVNYRINLNFVDIGEFNLLTKGDCGNFPLPLETLESYLHSISMNPPWKLIALTLLLESGSLREMY